MRRFAKWADRNPLLAVWLGLVVCLALVLFTHAMLDAGPQSSRVSVSTSSAT